MIVLSESAVVFDQRKADKGVIADPITANPGIEEREGEKSSATASMLMRRSKLSQSLTAKSVTSWRSTHVSEELLEVAVRLLPLLAAGRSGDTQED